MPGIRHRFLVGLLLLTASSAYAGGSHYGLAPGSNAQLAGRIMEWAVPTPAFARDPAPGPDGRIYIAVMHGNKIARFDPQTTTFHEWVLPPGAKPHGVLVDSQGQVWYTGNGNGTIGHLDPSTGKVVEHTLPSGGDPHTLVIDAQGIIWFTVQGGNRLGRLDTQTGAISEFTTAGNPYGITLDKAGHVWFCQISASKLGKLDPHTGVVTELVLANESQPRRMASAPDGMVWVTLYGKGTLLRVDPNAFKVVQAYAMPGGPQSGPYAVTVDGAGIVWANEFATDTIVRLDPQSGKTRRFALPLQDAGVRKMSLDAEGRLWYMGSHSGRLGVLE